MNTDTDNIKYAEFKLLVDSESLQSVDVTRCEVEQMWIITVNTRGKSYQLSLEKHKRTRLFASLEIACKHLVKAGCLKFNVNATGYALAPQPA